MPMTRRYRCWLQGKEKQKLGDCGPLYAMTVPPAVWFAYSPDHKGEHPKQHLRNFSGFWKLIAYAGFHHLYQDGRIQEAACWAHLRRKFYDIHLAHASSIAAEALERIAARGKPPNLRRETRQQRSLLCWHRCVLGWRKRCLLCRGNPIPQSPSAMDSRWSALLHYCDNGQIEMV